MRIDCDPALMEEVVRLEIRRREDAGDLELFARYHQQADAIYGEVPAEEWEEQFHRLHQAYFSDLGFRSHLEEVLAEFPILETAVEGLVVARALSHHDEGADLSTDRRLVGLTIQAQRFLDPPALRCFLRHEFSHVADMLDLAFGYTGRLSLAGLSPAEENLVRDRYGVLWDLFIDGRLERAGHEPGASREQRRRAFDHLYRRLPQEAQDPVFQALWSAEALTHDELLEMARGVPALLSWAGVETEGMADEPILLPGTPCPLCRFPTHAWVLTWTHTESSRSNGTTEPEVLDLIQADFPNWSPRDGACERCVELYRVRAGMW